MSKPLPPIPEGKEIEGSITKTMDRRFLSSLDLLGQGDVTLTIERVAFHDVIEFENGNQEEKAHLLHFAEIKKPLVLNKTNIRALVYKFGTNKCKEWVGQKVCLRVEAGRYFGQQGYAVRVVL